jgi:hypothetical protein
MTESEPSPYAEAARLWRARAKCTQSSESREAYNKIAQAYDELAALKKAREAQERGCKRH